MREILFRGKTEDGKWEYGYPYEIYRNCHTRKVIARPPDAFGKGKYTEIIDETLSQFTGLTDKNGTKIFEGDIVNYPDTYLSWSGDVDVKGNVGAVEWDKRTMCFYFSNRIAVDMEEFFVLNGCMTDVEVIGNIHDNPELIGGDGNGSKENVR